MRRISFLLLALAIAVFARGQTPAESSSPRSTQARLKVGVALEGGGALGLAHIGVLQWFEDHHIAIDYIAGTSMGGVVGGLYAIGKSPKELEEIVTQQSRFTASDRQILRGR